MASGFGPADGVQDTIAANTQNEIDFARSRLAGQGSKYCLECGTLIPEKRRQAIPSCIYCITCQTLHDEQQSHSASYYNRRGSKDSQLR